ncbi:hypothetical protein KEJ13_09380 [Candidatus Bathyarchaeota archaeon]|nr:hypothetical protein [Candidatus Bathyarchaeota archaeon]
MCNEGSRATWAWITVRVDPTLKTLLKKLAKTRRIQVSDLIRELMIRELARLSYLEEEEKKALGIQPIHISEDESVD